MSTIQALPSLNSPIQTSKEKEKKYRPYLSESELKMLEQALSYYLGQNLLQNPQETLASRKLLQYISRYNEDISLEIKTPSVSVAVKTPKISSLVNKPKITDIPSLLSQYEISGYADMTREEKDSLQQYQYTNGLMNQELKAQYEKELFGL